jgi:hypothetical protein
VSAIACSRNSRERGTTRSDSSRSIRPSRLSNSSVRSRSAGLLKEATMVCFHSIVALAGSQPISLPSRWRLTSSRRSPPASCSP